MNHSRSGLEKDMGKVIVVASGKGGTGKTTSVGAISSCLAALGHKNTLHGLRRGTAES
jgi:septum formation inhibitor-activating ATPase MinD